MVVTVDIIFFWYVMPRSLVDVFQSWGASVASIFSVEDFQDLIPYQSTVTLEGLCVKNNDAIKSTPKTYVKLQLSELVFGKCLVRI
jgi:hypothetical protein